MKRIIATVLSAIVGLFGYTIVDTAIEARVSSVESEVVELREEVSALRGQMEDYHGIADIPTTSPNGDVTHKPVTTKKYPTTVRPTETKVYTTKVPTTKLPESTTAAANDDPIDAFTTTVPATAVYLVDSGYCGDYATWELYSDGKLIIGGKGAMYNATPGWDKYDGTIKKVVIKDGVTSIGGYAFSDCTSLTSVTIPDSVTSIEGYAFSDCTSLETVTLGNGVKTIYIQAFYNCTNLKTVTIGANLTKIVEMAFANCGNLTDVYYAGTEAQWNAITIGESNARLTDATIHYNA